MIDSIFTQNIDRSVHYTKKLKNRNYIITTKPSVCPNKKNSFITKTSIDMFIPKDGIYTGA